MDFNYNYNTFIHRYWNCYFILLVFLEKKILKKTQKT